MPSAICLMLLSLSTVIQGHNRSLQMVSIVHSSVLAQFDGYRSVDILHLEIPEETAFASFKIEKVLRTQCTSQSISLFIKHGGVPVIVTPTTRFPASFKTIQRRPQHYMDLRVNQTQAHFNLTSPQPGCYYLVAFLSARQHDKRCHVHVKTTLYVERRPIPVVTAQNRYHVSLVASQQVLRKFFLSKPNQASIVLTDLQFAGEQHPLVVQIKPGSFPLSQDGSFLVRPGATNVTIPLTEEECWHFVQFSNSTASFNYSLTYSSSKNNSGRFFESGHIFDVTPYTQMGVFRESHGVPLEFNYQGLSGDTAVLLTSNESVVVKFELAPHTDVGITLQLRLFLVDQLEDQVIVACLRQGRPELPQRNGSCHPGGHGVLLLNKTTPKDLVEVAYPEYGTWYASFRLFCGKCAPCDCPKECLGVFEECVKSCRRRCTSECRSCSLDCKKDIVKGPCPGCECDGRCLQAEPCNATVLFNITSSMCGEGCQAGGVCKFMVYDGDVLGTCACAPWHRGWVCDDISPFKAFIPPLSLPATLLHLLTALCFLPTIVVAFRRKYRVEALTYAVFFGFAVTFHLCESNAAKGTVCGYLLPALRLEELFTAFLCVYVTLIAVADVPYPVSSVCYTVGLVVLPILLTINSVEEWVHLVAPVAGVVIVGASWAVKWRKVGCDFIDRGLVFVYVVPVGVLCIFLGLIFLGIFVTFENYVYLHSAWHFIMAVAVVLALPGKGMFMKEVRNHSCE